MTGIAAGTQAESKKKRRKRRDEGWMDFMWGFYQS
jgi:hypothetical protein